jgi:hypothetical protein
VEKTVDYIVGSATTKGAFLPTKAFLSAFDTNRLDVFGGEIARYHSLASHDNVHDIRSVVSIVNIPCRTTWRGCPLGVYRGAPWCNLGVYNSLTAFVGNTEQKCRHIRGLVSQLIPAWALPRCYIDRHIEAQDARTLPGHFMDFWSSGAVRESLQLGDAQSYRDSTQPRFLLDYLHGGRREDKTLQGPSNRVVCRNIEQTRA